MKDKHDKVTPDFPDMEGDYIYTKAEHAIDKADLERSDGDARYKHALDPVSVNAVKNAFEEMDIHFTVRKFEEALHTHGLDHLLGQMTAKGAHTLLQQALKIHYDRTGDH